MATIPAMTTKQQANQAVYFGTIAVLNPLTKYKCIRYKDAVISLFRFVMTSYYNMEVIQMTNAVLRAIYLGL